MLDPTTTERHSIEQLADSFIASYRSGTYPTVEEYAQRYPELASQLRDLLGALLLLEQNAPRPEQNPAIKERSLRQGILPDREIGDFVIVREIARGGMGIVYEAVQKSLGRRVALKILSVQGISDDVHLERFLLEARAASRLHHSHIVPVFDVGEHGDLHFYAMQFIQGQNLEAVIAELAKCRQQTRVEPIVFESQAELPQEKAEGLSSSHSGRPFYLGVARVGRQIAEALSYAHGEGILHRDIKPSNLLLDVKGSAWITDFGLAKAEDSDGLTRTGDFVGTLRYMAPERLRSQCDSRSDVYGLGATLYELLTLRPFFENTSRGELVHKILHTSPPPPSKLDPWVPRDLETIVLKAIAKEPAARYQTAALLAEDLDRFLADRPIKARRVTFGEQAVRWCRRNPVIATLLSLVAVLMVTTVTILALGNLRIQEAQESTRMALYVDDVNLASHIWESDHGTRRQAMELLAAYLPQPGKPDRREFAWRYQWNRLQRGMQTFQGPERPRGLAIDRQGRLLALDGRGILFIWEGESEEPRQILLTPQFTPHLAAMAAAGNFAALDDGHGVLHLVDLSTGELKHRLAHQSSLRKLKFADNGQFLATIDQNKGAKIWDVTSGQMIREMTLQHEGGIRDALSPDGKHLIVSRSPGTRITLYDLETGESSELRQEEVGFFSNEPVFSPDGQFILTGCEGGDVRAWNASSREFLWLMRSGSAARKVKFFPDGKRYVVGSSTGNLSIWDFATRQPIRVLKGQVKSIYLMAISEDGESIASIDASGVLRRWDLSLSGNARALPHLGGQIDEVVYSADGTQMAIAGLSHGVQLSNLETNIGFQVADNNPARKVAFSRDGTCLACGGTDATVRLIDLRTGHLARTLKPPAELRLPSKDDLSIDCDIGGLQFSPDGRWLAATYGNTTDYSRDFPAALVIWNLADGTVLRTYATTTQISALALSPNGSLLAAAGHNGEILLCSTANWEQFNLWSSESGSSYCCAQFSPDGLSLLLGCSDGTLEIWDVKTRQLLRLVHAHGEHISAMAISPDGQTLATTSWDRTVKLWHMPTYRELTTIPASVLWLYSVNFSPDGNTLVAGGVDGQLRQWDGTLRR